MINDLKAARTVLAMIEGLDLLLDSRVGHDAKVHRVKNDLKVGATYVREEIAEMEERQRRREEMGLDD